MTGDPRPGLSHQDAARVHAIKRLFQRHGVLLHRNELLALEAEIIAGVHQNLGPRASRTGGIVYEVEIRGMKRYAIWRNDLGCIATFLLGPGWIAPAPKKAKRA